MATTTVETGVKARHLPEHGPIDPVTGREVLLSIRNVDITFGKGDSAVTAVQNASFDIDLEDGARYILKVATINCILSSSFSSSRNFSCLAASVDTSSGA